MGCYNGLDKIEKLNEKCNNTLSITRYYDHWELSSYGDDTPFCYRETIDNFSASTLRELIENACRVLHVEV